MLNIITALKAEAAPFIEGLSLKQQPLSKRLIFSGCGIQLAISGPGCTNARALTSYFLGRHNPENQNPEHQRELTYWLNFGIAGSAAWEIGDLVLAHTVTDQSPGKTGQIWTLENGINLNLPGAHICTVESPQATYYGHNVYDMETAGMISVLSDRNLLGRAFIVKIISDGPSKPVESLTKQDLQQMIHGRKKDILAITEKIHSASLE
ncbi:hypothetical protein [Candidatus Spongiihabitans sp.]|uniref:hypothetical protein n=1 Tax=Candidatus Spongiihabitans sp. TaxID=3101308 RepID=UPI003C6EC168